jgi:hypothetical protein
MAKAFPVWLFLIFCVASAQAQGSALFCQVDISGEQFQFRCHDSTEGENYSAAVDPLLAGEFSAKLQDKGVEIVEAEEFLRRTLQNSVSSASQGPRVCEYCLEREYRSYFRSQEFNALDANSPVIQHLRLLAEALHQAGVCQINPKIENYNDIGINSPDDVLQHFLCISNSESVFGQRNIGMGGRGPWGIHPMHNLKKGSSIPGSSRRMDRDGLCYGTQAVVRDKNGAEIKQTQAYRTPEVIRDNAACALKIYQFNASQDGFRAWGTSKSWGSNRHCSLTTKRKYKFKKILGKLACCTNACRSSLIKEQHL